MDSDAAECPLCMEFLEIDDLNFYPCSCGYQICKFCWHRIRTDENGLCPACRKAYSEDPAIYRPLTQDEITRINKERKQRETQRKQKISENRKHLSNVRVIQKNLLFVVGLSQRLTDPEVLKKQEYFGKFGKIQKIVINPSTNYAGPQGPSASAYITFSKEEETLRAILGVNNVHLYGRTIRASLGTTKYCTHYLRNTQCHKADCMYLHEAGDESGSFTKEDMQQGKHQLYEKELLENFLKSVQSKRRSVDLDQFPQMLEEEKEEWLTEDTPAAPGSALPPKAAWAEKEIKDQEEESSSTNREVSVSDVESVSANDTRISNLSNQVTPSDDFELKEPSQTAQGLSPKDIPNKSDALDANNLASGWGTVSDTATTTPYTDGISEDPGGGTYRSSSWFDDGLGLNNLQVDGDDDLGFDPFTESHRGLEEFITANEDPYDSVLSGIPSFYPPGSWNSQVDMNNHSSGGVASYLTSSEYSLFGKNVSSTGSFFDVWGNSGVYSPQSTTQLSQTSENSGPGSSKYTTQSSQPKQESDMKSWQDGLRALLPNINISFSASLENLEEAKLARQAGRKEVSSSKPPPGFVQTEDEGEQNRLLHDSSIVWSKMRSEKEKKRSPPGLAMGQGQQDQVCATKTSQDATLTGRSPPGASWNAIVSGQTHNISKSTSQESPRGSKTVLSNPTGSQQAKVNPGTSADVTGIAKPFGKPSAMFSLSTSQNTNKPTAKVKPLKCVVPSNDFLVPTVPFPANVNERKSCMNDLDDIDFNDPLPAVSTYIATQPMGLEGAKISEEYQGQSGSWKKTNKRKKKKKEGSVKEAVTTKQDPFARNGSFVQPSTEAETKRIVLERPLSKEGKEKAAQSKVGKVKAMEKPTGIVPIQQELKVGKAPGKVDPREVARPKVKPSEVKPGLSAPEGIRVATQRPPNTRTRSTPLPDSPPRPVAPIRILKSQPQPTGSTTTQTLVQSSPHCAEPSPLEMYDRESLGRLAESTKLLLQTVLSETEVIKSNTEQISKDLKAALDKCKDPPLSASDLEKLNCIPLLELKEELSKKQGDNSVIDTSDLEKQVESARREAELLEVKLKDVIRKNMASDIETLRKKGPDPKQKSGKMYDEKK